jgi:hypothetical protein
MRVFSKAPTSETVFAAFIPYRRISISKSIPSARQTPLNEFAHSF